MTEYQFKILKSYYYIVQNKVKYWNSTVRNQHGYLDGDELHDRLLFRMIKAADNLEKNNITDKRHIRNYLYKCLDYEIPKMFRDAYKNRASERNLATILHDEELESNINDFVYWKDHIGDVENMAIINVFLQEVKEIYNDNDKKKIIEMLTDGASVEDIAIHIGCPKSKIYSLKKQIKRYFETNFG